MSGCLTFNSEDVTDQSLANKEEGWKMKGEFFFPRVLLLRNKYKLFISFHGVASQILFILHRVFYLTRGELTSRLYPPN